MASRAVVVSIHDVTPALDAPVRQLWSLCKSVGIVPALLVVPDWHGRWPIESFPLFMEWVRACAAEGADIFLHGERHDEVGLPRNVSAQLRAVGRTAREGEFLTLDTDAASQRIDRGLARLASHQLDPIGFIPPAWLAKSSTHDVVRARGLAVSEDVASIQLHRQRRRVPSPVIRWSGRTTMRAAASAQVNAWRWRTLQRTPVVRIALHPQDLDNPLTAASLRRELTRWAQMRPSMSYRELEANSLL